MNFNQNNIKYNNNIFKYIFENQINNYILFIYLFLFIIILFSIYFLDL